MDHNTIIKDLWKNKEVFLHLLVGIEKQQYLWKPEEGKWCLLEIVCHLYDEEREDFRTRLKHTLETPEQPLPAIDPLGWVMDRKYTEQDYNKVLCQFLDERRRSVEWLHSLSFPQWTNVHHHPKFGALSAELFLANWLAHDALHIRQIIRLKYEYLKQHSVISLAYAGDW